MDAVNSVDGVCLELATNDGESKRYRTCSGASVISRRGVGRFLLVVTVAVGGCGESLPIGDASGDNGAGDAGVRECPRPGEAPAPDARLATWPEPSLLHLIGAVDAHNLWLEANGFARWNTAACDSGGSYCGSWRSDGADIVVAAATGNELRWPLAYGARSVRLSRVSTGGVSALVDTITETVNQEWAFGMICPHCCGGLGPKGLYTCDVDVSIECD
jgi:hypothetical protein